MLEKEDIKKIPVENYTKESSIVLIWCTNSDAHINAIKEEFLPKWHLKLLTIWNWIKIDQQGNTICAFNEPLKKQPFEQIFVAVHENCNAIWSERIPKDLLVCSVPSSVHSHKPPLRGQKFFN